MNQNYTNPALRAFEKEISLFREGKRNTVNIEKYLISKGIFVAQEGYPPALREGKIKEYESFQKMWNALMYLQNRTELAKRHELEERNLQHQSGILSGK